MEASEKALEKAIELCQPGALLSDISSVIEDTIKSYGYNPISNLTGHGLDQFDLHAEPQIPNIKTESQYELKKGQVIAIEPFATDGAGRIKESGDAMIFRMVMPGPVRNLDARGIIKFASSREGLPFAERWIELPLIKTRLALKELRDKNILYDYPVLKEVANGFVSQSEHTVIVGEEPVVTTKLLDEPET